MGEEVGGHARVADHGGVCAAVAEPLDAHGVEHHVVEPVVGAAPEVEQRAQEELTAVGAEEEVVHDFPRIASSAGGDGCDAPVGRRLVLELVTEGKEVGEELVGHTVEGGRGPVGLRRLGEHRGANLGVAQPRDPLGERELGQRGVGGRVAEGVHP